MATIHPTHAHTAQKPAAKPKYAVLVYYGINPADPDKKKVKLGDSWDETMANLRGNEVNASDHMLKALKELAPKTKGSPVSFFVEGYEQNKSGKWRAARYLISNGKVEDQSNRLPGRNISLFDPAALKDFIKSAPEAEKTMFFFGAHGGGFPGFQGETMTNGKRGGNTFDAMSMGDFSKSISDSGRRLDLLDLDTCFGGQWEVLSPLRGVSPHIIASPEATFYQPTSTDPSPQAIIPSMQKLIQDPSLSTASLAKHIIRNAAANAEEEHVLLPDSTVKTLGFYDTAALASLDKPMDKLGYALAEGMDHKKTRKLILKAADNALSYAQSDYKDLKSFLHYLKKYGVLEKTGMKDTAREIKHALKAQGSEMYKNEDFEDAGPLSVFVPAGPSENEIKEALTARVKSGEKLSTAQLKFHRSFSQQAESIGAMYDSVPNVSGGWKRFADKLLHLLVTDVVPQRIASASIELDPA